jgi:urease accessory protein
MYTKNPRAIRLLATLLTATLTPAAALAHPGHDGAGAGFTAGALHVLSGFDHVLMIVAVSAWTARLQRAQRLLTSVCLGLFIAIGALVPLTPSGPGLETAIALTVAGSGCLLAAGRHLPMWATACVAALCALIHGLAHGVVAPAGSGFVPGVALTTAGLALLASGIAARLQSHRQWLRMAGLLSALSGAAMLFNS